MRARLRNEVGTWIADPMPDQDSSLVSVFAQADADADGSLTADEYKAYVATVQAAGAAGGSAGQPAE